MRWNNGLASLGPLDVLGFLGSPGVVAVRQGPKYRVQVMASLGWTQ